MHDPREGVTAGGMIRTGASADAKAWPVISSVGTINEVIEVVARASAPRFAPEDSR